MSIAPMTAGLPEPASDWGASVRGSPLVAAAAVVTLGMAADRYAQVPLAVSGALAGGSLLGWIMAWLGRRRGLALVYLALAGTAVGALRHHVARSVRAVDDVGRIAPAEARPARVRGVVEERFGMPAARQDPLRSQDREAVWLAILGVRQWRQADGWQDASGRVQLVLLGAEPPEPGAEVEVLGLFGRLAGAGNPGERDPARLLGDQGVGAQLVVRRGAGSVRRLAGGGMGSSRAWLAWLREQGRQALGRWLPPRTSGLAAALILGDGSALPAEAWEKFLRTGVIAVLVVSGQHLLMAAFLLTLLLRALGMRLRARAVLVAALLLGYALLTGGKPPALRAALMVLAGTGAVLLLRRAQPASLLAGAWLGIALLQPGDLFTPGCQLSFLAVSILFWLPRPLLGGPQDPLDRLVEVTRPAWERLLRRLGRRVGEVYLASLVLWLALTPLAASHYHLIAPAGLFLGPPLAALTMVALFLGLVLLAAASLGAALGPLVTPACWPLGWLLDCVLRLGAGAVSLAERCPGSHFHVPDLPGWWLGPFYLALVLLLTSSPRRGQWWRPGLCGLAWVAVGLGLGVPRGRGDELRCTFLAVGHGGCVVLELPDGRTLLYDAGAIRGPEVGSRQVAPYLWWRGIRRIDEVILSHADLDHFNGLVALLDRFAVGQVTCNPSFLDRTSPAARFTLEVLARRGIPVRTARAGQVLEAGVVRLEVLHPPAEEIPGPENVRSLVLYLRWGGRSLLLTGDLEGEGLTRLLAQPPRPVDVLMAPHHGSARLDTGGLTRWARPALVVSCQGAPRRSQPPVGYRTGTFLTTHEHGAITCRFRAGRLDVETHRTALRLEVGGH